MLFCDAAHSHPRKKREKNWKSPLRYAVLPLGPVLPKKLQTAHKIQSVLRQSSFIGFSLCPPSHSFGSFHSTLVPHLLQLKPVCSSTVENWVCAVSRSLKYVALLLHVCFVGAIKRKILTILNRSGVFGSNTWSRANYWEPFLMAIRHDYNNIALSHSFLHTEIHYEPSMRVVVANKTHRQQT